MSEKRFRANFDVSIYDSEREEYISVSERGLEEIAKRMNEQQAIIQYLTIEKHQADKRFQTIIAELKKENEQFRKQCFELEKDYLIETSDISDKIYLDDEIRELKQRYGV